MTDILSPASTAPAAASAYDPDAPDALWAVGAAGSNEGLIEYPVSNRDVAADTTWAMKRLTAMGVTAGSLVDLVHNYREGGQFWPYYRAANELGAPVLNGMATPWDVGRTEMYTRRFDLQVLMGVSSDTVEGLKAFGHSPAEVLARPALLCAREPAASALEAEGLRPWRMTLLGPILLVAPSGEGAPYDASEWTVETDAEGRLLVTSGPHRAARFERLDTGLRGRVEGGLVFLDSAA